MTRAQEIRGAGTPRGMTEPGTGVASQKRGTQEWQPAEPLELSLLLLKMLLKNAELCSQTPETWPPRRSQAPLPGTVIGVIITAIPPILF